jgi:hypothetical protein
MFNNNDLSIQYAAERHRDDIVAAQRDRRAAACNPELPLARRAARPLGRLLFNTGGWLLRYGKDDRAATRVYRASAGSVKLN